MLIYDSSTRLGDRILSKEEALLKSYEGTDRRLQQYRSHDHEELKNEAVRTGRRMHSSDLIFKVRQLNPKLWIEETNSQRFGRVFNFYTIGVNEEHQEEKVCCGTAFYPGWMPEFSWIEVDRADLPIKEHRGWRTVVLRLLKAGYLTWNQVRDTFGDAEGLNSRRWREETQPYRL